MKTIFTQHMTVTIEVPRDYEDAAVKKFATKQRYGNFGDTRGRGVTSRYIKFEVNEAALPHIESVLASRPNRREWRGTGANRYSIGIDFTKAPIRVEAGDLDVRVVAEDLASLQAAITQQIAQALRTRNYRMDPGPVVLAQEELADRQERLKRAAEALTEAQKDLAYQMEQVRKAHDYLEGVKAGVAEQNAEVA